MLPAFPDSVRVVEEPGQMLNPTPVEVYQAKQGIDPQQAMDRDQGKDVEPEP